ncbi:MAG: site-specific integrase, partial [Mesorhizobium sp.]
QTLSMTMRYAHLATNDLDGCVFVLETPRCDGATKGAENSMFSSPVTTPTSSKPARKPKSEAAAVKVSRKSFRAN